MKTHFKKSLVCITLTLTLGILTPINLVFAKENISYDDLFCKDIMYNKVYPEENTSDLIRNPGMGWVLYVDAFWNENDDTLPSHSRPFGNNAAAYWAEQDRIGASEKASIFYIRAPWSQFEPTEGHYAWIYDNNYKQLIQGALDRGLKLAFRIYNNSQHSYQQATPEYVKEAGAKGYTNTYWTPYDNDVIMREKFEKFLDAFSAEYDDADIVDYIDAMGFGWWGEMHHLKFDWRQPGANKRDLVNWLSAVYKSRFHEVMLGAQQGGSVDMLSRNLVQQPNGYDILRRDSLGNSRWFPSWTKKQYIRTFDKGIPLFAENYYNYMKTNDHIWKDDGFESIRDCLKSTLEDAKYCRANTLDLRVPQDAAYWMANPDLVDDFIVNGGYRLVPESIKYPKIIDANKSITIEHVWKNTGLGRMPNNRPAWNYKYKVAFALLDKFTDKPVSIGVTEVEPSTWLKGNSYNKTSHVTFENVPNGIYDFAIAIVDTTRKHQPKINLAINTKKSDSGWYILGPTIVWDIEIMPPPIELPESLKDIEDLLNSN